MTKQGLSSTRNSVDDFLKKNFKNDQFRSKNWSRVGNLINFSFEKWKIWLPKGNHEDKYFIFTSLWDFWWFFLIEKSQKNLPECLRSPKTPIIPHIFFNVRRQALLGHFWGFWKNENVHFSLSKASSFFNFEKWTKNPEWGAKTPLLLVG